MNILILPEGKLHSVFLRWLNRNSSKIFFIVTFLSISLIIFFNNLILEFGEVYFSGLDGAYFDMKV